MNNPKEHLMASAVSALTGTPASSNASSSPPTTAAAPAPSEEMFLQLLVSQLQNQDPLNPTDSTQFVTQLAQFSQLEQVMAIRTDIENYAAASQASPTSNPSTLTTTQTQA
jgi:flagellar basal-body rod modification protein FlgD